MMDFLPLLILINVQIIQGVLEWTVIGKVTEYGQNVTLFCHVQNCCPKDAGWDRWTPVQRTLFIDIKTGRPNKKYDGKVDKDGYTLVIQNLTENDLNVSYSCLYGVTLGEQKILLEEDVFTYFSPGQPNVQNGKSIISKGHIAGIMVGVVVLTAVAVAWYIFHNWKRKKKLKFKFQVANEIVPLIVKDSSHIECKEGEDAIFTYESQTENLSVKLLKAGNMNIEHEHRDGQYIFILKDTKTVDSGEYNLQVRKFFRKQFHLQITAYFLEDPTDIECTEGDEAIIKCKVHPGSPSVKWFKNDNDLSRNDKYKIVNEGEQHQLKLLESKLDDNGEYCVQVGKSYRKVQLKIKAYFLEDPIDIECTEGDEAIITCKVHPGSPPVRWFKNNNDVSGSDNYKISSKDAQHQLKLLESKLDDNGEYSVQVGKSFRKVQLKVKGFFLENPSNVDVIEGEDAILTCKVRPGSTSLKWLKDGIEIFQNENHILSNKDKRHERHLELLITKTKRSDSGEYIVQVAEFSRKLQLNVKSYFLEDPSDTECIEGEDAIFKCKVCSDSPSVQLLKDGIDITKRTNYEKTSEGQLHNLKLMNTNTSDEGYYFVHVGKSYRKVQLIVKEKPSTAEIDTYMEAIKAGTEDRKYVRIQIMGKGRAGKTSLVRRLLKRDIKGIESTDGVDIDRTCTIKESSGEWSLDKVETEMEKSARRILQTLNMKQTGKEPVSFQRGSSENQAEKNENRTLQTDINKSPPADENKPLPIAETKPFLSIDEIDINETDNEQMTQYKNLNQDGKNLNVADTVDDSSQIKPIHDTSESQNHVNSDKSDQITDAMIERMDDILLGVKNKKEKDLSDGLVECGIWDFAGQKEYYITHQTFCTQHAIYILVADIRDDIQPTQLKVESSGDIKNEIQPTQFESESSGEYIDFWLDSVHCFREDILESTAKELRPPVVIVFTGIDNVPDIEKKKKECAKIVLETFGCHEKGGHTRGMIHFISNTESPEEEIENLRKHISEIAGEMHFFSEKLPTSWIQLENALRVLKTLKEKENMGYCEKWENIKKLAQKISIQEDELLQFLNHQHKIGNVIFFEDKRDYIILEPRWLVDCFRCLVCDDDKKTCTKTELYELKYKGILSEQLIDKLFTKVPTLMIGKCKNHILDVMEKFAIIVKPKSLNSYYMPFMIETSSSLEVIKKEFNVKDCNCTPWLVLEFNFLPIAYSNHIMFNYIKEELVCNVTTGNGNWRPAIYTGKAVVDLDKTACRRLFICFSKNAICIQIWKWAKIEEITYRSIVKRLCNAIEELENKLNHTLDYKIKSKCNTGDYLSSSDRITYEELSEKCIGNEYRCVEHDGMHYKDDIENTWLKHAPDIHQRRTEKKRHAEHVHVMLKKLSEQLEKDYENDSSQSKITDEGSEKEAFPVSCSPTENLRKPVLVLIITGQKFKKGSGRFRSGAEIDLQHMFEIFLNLDFEVQWHQFVNRTSEDLLTELNKCAVDQSLIPKKCLIIIVSSYGGKLISDIKTYNGWIRIDEILDIFDSCQYHVNHIPKLVFIQADSPISKGPLSDAKQRKDTLYGKWHIPEYLNEFDDGVSLEVDDCMVVLLSQETGAWSNKSGSVLFTAMYNVFKKKINEKQDIDLLLTMTEVHKAIVNYETYNRDKTVMCLSHNLSEDIIFKSNV